MKLLGNLIYYKKKTNIFIKRIFQIKTLTILYVQMLMLILVNTMKWIPIGKLLIKDLISLNKN